MIWLNSLKLRSKNPALRLKAIENLAADGSSGALARLVGCLEDNTAEVRLAAARAIGAGKHGRALPLVLTLLGHARHEVRDAAALSLGYLGDVRACKPLFGLLQDANLQVRATTAAALRKLGWKPANQDERAALKTSMGDALALALAGSPEGSPALRELTDFAGFVQLTIAAALEYVDDPGQIAPLIGAVNNADPIARIAAIHALSKAVAHPDVVGLLKRLVHESDPRIRLAAAEVLAANRRSDIGEVFLGLLRDIYFEVRLVAVQFLAKSRDPRYLPAFLDLLSDPDGDVRQKAALALSEIGSPMAIERLVLALSDEELPVRKAAQDALEKTDRNWMQSEAARRASKQLELLLQARPSWVRAATGHLLSRLQEAEHPAHVAA